MKYFSEITKEFYPSAEECLAAEAKVNEQRRQEQEKFAEYTRIREAKLKEVNEAYEAYKEARMNYISLKEAYDKEYGDKRSFSCLWF